MESENIKVRGLNARSAMVLYLLITLQTTCLCRAIQHVAKSGVIRQRTTNRGKSWMFKVTIPTPNKNWLRNKSFVWKVKASQPLFVKCRLGAARFQSLTRRALSRDRNLEAEHLPQKQPFLRELDWKTFCATKAQKNTEKMLKIINNYRLKIIFQVMRVRVKECRGQKHLKKTLYT